MSNFQYPESLNTFKQYNTVFIFKFKFKIRNYQYYIIIYNKILWKTLTIKVFGYNSILPVNNVINITKEILYKMITGNTKLISNITGPILFILGKDDLSLSKIILAIINKLQQAVLHVTL